jgi:hypothetical protein
VKKAPLEGDRILREPLLPDFLASADKPFFLSPRWNVRVYHGDVPVYDVGWISAVSAEAAIDYVRGMDFTSAVRYEAEEVKA